MVGNEGFEPPVSDSESDALPLGEFPMYGFYKISDISQMILRKKSLPCKDLRYFSLCIDSHRVENICSYTSVRGVRCFVEETAQLLCLFIRSSRLEVWPM